MVASLIVNFLFFCQIIVSTCASKDQVKFRSLLDTENDINNPGDVKEKCNLSNECQTKLMELENEVKSLNDKLQQFKSECHCSDNSDNTGTEPPTVERSENDGEDTDTTTAPQSETDATTPATTIADEIDIDGTDKTADPQLKTDPITPETTIADEINIGASYETSLLYMFDSVSAPDGTNMIDENTKNNIKKQYVGANVCSFFETRFNNDDNKLEPGQQCKCIYNSNTNTITLTIVNIHLSGKLNLNGDILNNNGVPITKLIVKSNQQLPIKADIDWNGIKESKLMNIDFSNTNTGLSVSDTVLKIIGDMPDEFRIKLCNTNASKPNTRQIIRDEGLAPKVILDCK